MTEREQDQASVRAVVDAVCRAIGAKHAAGVLAHYTPDAVHYTLAPPLRSAKPDAAALESWFRTWDGPIGCAPGELEITVAEDLALCTGFNHMTGTKTDGQAVDLWYRVTLALRRIDRRWRIVHEHESVPFYMDGSDKAALDLKP